MFDLKDFLEYSQPSDKTGETAAKQAQQKRNLDNIILQQPRIEKSKIPLKEGHIPSPRLLNCDTSSQNRHNLSGRLRNGLPWT